MGLAVLVSQHLLILFLLKMALAVGSSLHSVKYSYAQNCVTPLASRVILSRDFGDRLALDTSGLILMKGCWPGHQ